jgi:hypothetical protein
LGYAYFEAFLSDLIAMCLTKRPAILIPENKGERKDKTITYEQLLSTTKCTTTVLPTKV